ncbi:MAG: 2-amino-4-hydroxy-6-hydroxymethyldihydropteridine diphosphokinase [Akkermansiaceae bacterium]|nr:2-amino-4-hydroxy-6-hydroxymethyldihydropteridine diphosphokinase [Akkermansiaceae bacterium]
MPRVGIALGSNLGDRLANLNAACDCLREINTPSEPFLRASIYQTEPLLCPLSSPFFYNSVIEIHFNGSAFELLEITQSIEKKLGRVTASIRNAPRVIDIDLLYFGDEIIDSENLILPHPRITERSFVLQPLAEIRGDFILPNHTQTIAEIMQRLKSDET